MDETSPRSKKLQELVTPRTIRIQKLSKVKVSENMSFSDSSESDCFGFDSDNDPDYEPIVMDRTKKQRFIESDSEESCDEDNCDIPVQLNDIPSTSNFQNTFFDQNTCEPNSLVDTVTNLLVDVESPVPVSNYVNNCRISEQDDQVSDNLDISDILWGPISENPITFSTAFPCLIDEEIVNKIHNFSPQEVYALFVNDEIIDFLVTETNRYAHQKIEVEKETSSTGNLSKGSRLNRWQPVDRREMKKFFGIILWMGLVKMPSIPSYWKASLLYSNQVSKIMSRNRFEILLRMFHASNNETAPDGDRLYKVQQLIDLLLPKFQSVLNPQEEMCVDETIIPFRGRLSFKQYCPNKRHRYGMKLFKLCLPSGYTWNLKVYAGREAVSGKGVPQKCVLDLAEPLLYAGRTLFCDNWYTSTSLALELLKRSTHLVGTLRSNRKGNPKQVIQTKLKKGEIVAAQSSGRNKIIVLKWQDKRDVLMISTKHKDETVTKLKRGKEIVKPKMVTDYNCVKAFIDLSDQMSSYSTTLRRTIKWYRKILLELLFGTSIVNAWVLYNLLNKGQKPTMKITTFREELCLHFLQDEQIVNPPATQDSPVLHRLINVDGKKSTARRRCSGCYKIKRQTENRVTSANSVKRVITKCSVCDVFFCVACFSSAHNISKK